VHLPWPNLSLNILGKRVLKIGSDRRAGIDRRKSNSINVHYLLNGGNRVFIRRQEDKDRLFLVDHYSLTLFLAIVCILFLCVIDTLLTLLLIGHGAFETNLIFAYLMDISPYASIFLKYAATVVVTTCLLMFRLTVIRRANLSTHSILYFIAGAYFAIVSWELYLISNTVL